MIFALRSVCYHCSRIMIDKNDFKVGRFQLLSSPLLILSHGAHTLAYLVPSPSLPRPKFKRALKIKNAQTRLYAIHELCRTKKQCYFAEKDQVGGGYVYSPHERLWGLTSRPHIVFLTWVTVERSVGAATSPHRRDLAPSPPPRPPPPQPRPSRRRHLAPSPQPRPITTTSPTSATTPLPPTTTTSPQVAAAMETVDDAMADAADTTAAAGDVGCGGLHPR